MIIWIIIEQRRLQNEIKVGPEFLHLRVGENEHEMDKHTVRKTQTIFKFFS